MAAKLSRYVFRRIGKMIKANIDSIPKGKLHKLKKLKKKK